jgi:cell division protein FtsB
MQIFFVETNARCRFFFFLAKSELEKLFVVRRGCVQQLQKLKAENEKLKCENRALTRVVSKLTAAATKSGPLQSAAQPRK